MKSKHYSVFPIELEGDRLNQENWERLRVDLENDGGGYSIKNSAEAFEDACRNAGSMYRTAARKICEALREQGAARAVSFGVGAGVLEGLIKANMPTLKLICTDYTEKALQKLETVFLACDETRTFDMLNGDYGVWKDIDAAILFRVSTEFDFDIWKSIFARMSSAGLRRVIFIPTELATTSIMLREKALMLYHALQGKKNYFCGWLYSEKTIERMWLGAYEIKKKEYFEKTAIYVL